jgi:hypothetical protein
MRKAFHLLCTVFDEDLIRDVTEKLRVWGFVWLGHLYPLVFSCTFKLLLLLRTKIQTDSYKLRSEVLKKVV